MKLSAFLADRNAAPSANLEWHATEPWVRFGTRVVVFLCGGLLLASVLLSISGAVVATGAVSVDGQYKAVQHLEGGIVRKIFVRNGDRVAAGQELAQIDAAQVRANYAATAARVAELAIQEARLIAERDLKDRFEAPGSLTVTDGDNAKVLAAQQTLFEARRRAYLGQKTLYGERITQAESELTSTTAQLKARAKERQINEVEYGKLKPLFAQGYVSQPRMSGIERELARLGGEIGALEANMNKTRAAIAESKARLQQIDKDFVERAADDLQKVQASLAEQTESEKSLADRVNRTAIRAPVAGLVHALALTTEGGVLQPGATLMQIVPEGREFVVDGKIAPRDIDSVHVGQIAHVRFSAFDAHTTPRLDGVVRKVSAAELTDDQGHAYFTVEIEIPPAELDKLTRKQHLLPGMPAEVYLQTGDRSILSYFLKPLADMMARSFRER